MTDLLWILLVGKLLRQSAKIFPSASVIDLDVMRQLDFATVTIADCHIERGSMKSRRINMAAVWQIPTFDGWRIDDEINHGAPPHIHRAQWFGSDTWYPSRIEHQLWLQACYIGEIGRIHLRLENKLQVRTE
jgi:hypothetical protein